MKLPWPLGKLPVADQPIRERRVNASRATRLIGRQATSRDLAAFRPKRKFCWRTKAWTGGSVPAASRHPDAGADDVVRRQCEERGADERAGLILREPGALGGRGCDTVGDLSPPAD